jgi:hypothetical protein
MATGAGSFADQFRIVVFGQGEYLFKLQYGIDKDIDISGVSSLVAVELSLSALKVDQNIIVSADNLFLLFLQLVVGSDNIEVEQYEDT